MNSNDINTPPAERPTPLFVCKHCGHEGDNDRPYCGCGGPYRIPNPATAERPRGESDGPGCPVSTTHNTSEQQVYCCGECGGEFPKERRTSCGCFTTTTERPTTITDANEEWSELHGKDVVESDIARALELQLAEAKETERYLWGQLCDARSERNEACEQRDNWKAKYIQQNKDLGCELRDPNGTIWDYAKELIEQRNRLVDCLKHLRNKDWFRDGVSGRQVICGLDPDKVRLALATVKGGPNE